MFKVRLTAWQSLRIVLCSASVVMLAACGDKPQQQSMRDMKIPVSVVQVESKVTPIYVDLPGRVDAVEEAQIRARVTGIVTAINFKQGSDVNKGDLLFTIDPAPYEAARDQAAAMLKQAQAEATTAAALAQRYSKLIKENAISRQEYDTAMAGAQQAQAAVASAKANLKAATINLDYTKVTAPISGRIGKAEITVGALVSATQATHLATIQQLDHMYVDIVRPVGEVMALRRAIAQGVLTTDQQGATEVTAILEDRSIYDRTGRLLFSGVSVDPSTGQLSMRAEFPNPEHILLPGMYVRVRLEQGIDKNALLVPTQAVQYASNGDTSLMVVEDDSVHVKPVKLGNQIDGQVIITEGIANEAVVIVEGFQKIRPGAPVQAMPWKNEQAGPKSSPEKNNTAQTTNG